MKLFFNKIGTGKPLVIVHGLFGSSDNWATFAKSISDSRSCYLIDVRNHGKSPHSDDFDYNSMAEDISEFCSDQNIDSADFIGHSMGGKILMNFSKKSGHLIDKLIIADIAPKKYPVHHDQLIDAMKSLDLTLIKNRNEADQALKSKISNPGVRLFLLKNLKRSGSGFAWKINLPIIEQKIEEVGKAQEGIYFEKPTLFVRGELSNYILDDDTDLIKSMYPKFELVTLEKCGHWVHAEKPIEFKNAVISFLGIN